jgi:hypothetical protein
VEAGGVVDLDMKHLAGGATQHGCGLTVDFGKRGGGRVIGDWRLGIGGRGRD